MSICNEESKLLEDLLQRLHVLEWSDSNRFFFILILPINLIVNDIFEIRNAFPSSSSSSSYRRARPATGLGI